MVQPLTTSALRQSAIEQISWLVELPPSYSRDVLTDCSFWAFIANRFNIRDRISVWAHDNSWLTELVVLDKGTNWAKVGIVAELSFGKAEEETKAPDGYEVKWAGPTAKWRVLLNGLSIMDGMASKEEAAAFAEKHKKSVTPPK